jgi:NADPH-dependent 2,4-dienoyl-CoA reductase/sulfur reductase-like enzyme
MSRLIGAKQCILATGALERPFPVPGWTLPGVMTAGAAQTLLKASGLLPDGNIVLAGSGPLLYMLAWEIAAAGGRLQAVLDTTPRANWRSALPWLPDFLRSPYAVKGLRLLLSARRRVRFLSGVTDIALDGSEGAVERIRFRRRGGPIESLSADGVLLHQGVIPDINLSDAAGCAHDWDPVQLCWVPRTDQTFQSTVAGLAIAGDGAGIGGAESAVIAGEIAALGVIHRLGRISSDLFQRQLSAKRRDWRRRMRGRPFIDRLYQPAKQFRIPEDPATIVCRCEEVSAGRIRETIADGCQGPNQLKAFRRCGMGACQGRLCGTTVSELMADATGSTPAEIGHFHLRPPVKPITLAELAALRKE